MTSGRFTVSALFEPASDFSDHRWPLHLTVVGEFVLKCATDYAVSDFLMDVTASHPPLTLVGGEEVWLAGDRLVTKIVPNVALVELHRELCHGLLLLGARFEAPARIMQHFTPHVAVQKTARLLRGESVSVTQIALIGHAPGGDSSSRDVVARCDLRDLAALH